MHPYLPLSPSEMEEVVSAVGVKTADDLFSHIPASVKFTAPLPMAPALSEQETWAALQAMAGRNCVPDLARTFLGGGAYNHYQPAVVDALLQRAEFFTSYTPYQPEVSQGNLQALFEYQTMMCQLTGMEVANASLYEGATALAEAVLLAGRALPGRKEVLLARSIQPHYRAVVHTYLQNFDYAITEIPFTAAGQIDLDWLKKKVNENTLCAAVGYPNYFGVVEPLREFQSILLAQGGITITTTGEALALAYLESPGALGIEIACGEGQSLGLPLSFGGPYLGFLATRESHLRRLPGRLAGETVDSEGNRGFVLTLSTREQHIRREKATSNICTNQALCALSASIYMALMGRKGMQALALVNAKRAAFVREGLLASKKAVALFDGPFFNEFALTLPKAAELEKKGFVFGPSLAKDYPELKDGWLFAVTEMNDPATLKALIAATEAL